MPIIKGKVSQQSLLAGAAASYDLITRAYAHVIAEHCDPTLVSFVPGLGLGRAGFTALLQTYFSYFEPPAEWLKAQAATLGRGGALEEYDDLLELLHEHCITGSETQHWMAHLVATASMGDNHLWQDMGLPDRKALSLIMRNHFPALTAINKDDMKWKKFFYRQLCERAGVPICKSPNCKVCTDYDDCFSLED